VKVMFCWRCGLDVAMLDEEEFAVVELSLARAVNEIKVNARHQPPAIKEEFVKEKYRPVLEAYRKMTGHNAMCHPSHMLHHRISKYGPPCKQCGKPLRTPKAIHCAACGADRTQ
jgi:hypothetical protein